MGERTSPTLTVTLVVGSDSVRVSGRAAMIIALIATHADRVNAVPVGKLRVDFAHEQVKLEIRESLPAVRLDR